MDVSPRLQAYYDDLFKWLGPGGVEGWLERREARNKARKKVMRERVEFDKFMDEVVDELKS